MASCMEQLVASVILFFLLDQVFAEASSTGVQEGDVKASVLDQSQPSRINEIVDQLDQGGAARLPHRNFASGPELVAARSATVLLQALTATEKFVPAMRPSRPPVVNSSALKVQKSGVSFGLREITTAFCAMNTSRMK